MSAQQPRHWPGYTEEAHPEVFNTMPAQPQTLKPGQISEEKARQFFDEVRCLPSRPIHVADRFEVEFTADVTRNFVKTLFPVSRLFVNVILQNQQRQSNEGI